MIEPTRGTKHWPGLPVILLLALGTNWGLAFSFVKIGMAGGLSPYAYGFWQCIGGGLVLLAVAAMRGELPPLDRSHLRYYVVAGLTNIGLPSVVTLHSVQHLPVGVVVLLVTLAPLLTYGIAQLAGMEPFERRRALGILLGFVGTLFIVLPRASLPNPDAFGWVLFAMLTPAFYGASNVYIAHARPPRVASLALGAAMQIAAGLCFVPMILLTGRFHVPWPPFSAAEMANLGHSAAAGFGSLVFFELMRMSGPVFASQVGYIVCLTGVFWGKLFFGEVHSLWIWAAMATILGGLALVTWPKKSNAEPPSADSRG